eukprot:925069_1
MEANNGLVSDVTSKSITKQQPIETNGTNVTNGTNQQSIPTKRKLSPSDDDTNDHDVPRKKRKLNDSADIKQKVEQLFQQIHSLKQERDHFEKGMNVYKEAMQYYKQKYLKLVALFEDEEDEQTNNDDDSALLSVDHPHSNHNNCDLVNEFEAQNGIRKNNADGSSTHPQFECHVCCKTHEKVKGHKGQNNKWYCLSCWIEFGDDPNEKTEKSDIYDFEANYHVSVRCHRCSEHFDDHRLYQKHLRKHYTVAVCDLKAGCTTKLTGFTRLAEHIASHTKDYPWRCNNCDHATSSKGNLKKHWSLIHKPKKDKETIARKKQKEKQLSSEDDEDDETDTSQSELELPVILCTGLAPDQMRDYGRFKHQFRNVAIFVTKWSSDVTHLVTTVTIEDDDGILKSRTMKYFQSVVAGCWVLCFDWIEKCLAKNQLYQERSFEVLGDRKGRGACNQSRELRNNDECKGLFANVIVFIDAEFKHTKLDHDLQSLFTTGGAEIMKISMLDMKEYRKDSAEKTMVFVYDKSQFDLSTPQEENCRKFGILPMGLQEVFDLISNYKAIATLKHKRI